MNKYILLVILMLPFTLAAYDTTDIAMYWCADYGYNHQDCYTTGKDGTPQLPTSPSNTSAGFIDWGFDFDGGNDDIVFSGVDLDSTEFTVVGWVNITGTGGTDTFWESDTRHRAKIDNNDDFVCRIYDAASAAVTTVKSDLKADSWEFIACRWNSTHICSYHNGSQVDCQASASIHASDADFTIGKEYVFANLYNGQMDEVIVYNRSLTDSEISTMYTDGLAGTSLKVQLDGAATPPSAAQTSYYFDSVNGNDSNNCSTPALACKTLAFLESDIRSLGYIDDYDTVYLMANSSWSCPLDAYITLESKMAVSAYGTGAKPQLNGSIPVSGGACWTNTVGNIWRFDCAGVYKTLNVEIAAVYDMDYGDDGRALKRERYYSGLNSQGEFYHNYTGNYAFYMYSSSNPYTYYGTLDLAQKTIILDYIQKNNVNITGLEIQMSGRHGIGGYQPDDIYIADNYVHHHGTNAASYDWSGQGNCIEVTCDVDGWTVINNNVSQCWDAGISDQAYSGCPIPSTIQNVYIAGNIITASSYGYEYINTNAANGEYDRLIEHNTIDTSGSIWYALGADSGRSMRLASSPPNSNNNTYRDNLYVNSTTRIYEYATASWSGSAVIDYNFIESGIYTQFAIVGGTPKTLAQWQTTYLHDVNSQEDSAGMSSNYVPQLGSLVCTTGHDGSYVGAIPCPSNYTVTVYYDGTVYETQSVNWAVSIDSSVGDTWDSVGLEYGVNTYTTTKTVVGADNYYNATFSIPADGVTPQEYTFYYTQSGTVYNITSFNVTVSQITLYNCSGDNVTLNLSIYNENTPTSPIHADVEVYAEYWTGSGSTVNNYTFSGTNQTYYEICLNPTNASVYSDIYVKYAPITGFLHRWYLQGVQLSNNTRQVSMYNFINTTGVSDITIVVRNIQNYAYYPRVIGKLQRFYASEGVWRTVQMDKSGDYGQVIFNIYEENQDYRFIFLDESNNVLDMTDSMKFICTSGHCSVTYLLTPYGLLISNQDIQTSVQYDNATDLVKTSWQEPTGESVTINTVIYKKNKDSDVLVCNKTSTGASGSHYCDVSTYTGVMQLYVYSTRDGATTLIDSEVIERLRGKLFENLSREEQGFWTMGIVGTVIFMGIASPVMVIIMTIVGLIMVYFLGILSVLNISFIILAAVIGIALAVKLRQ